MTTLTIAPALFTDPPGRVPSAVYSSCRRYRYVLTYPALDGGSGTLLWILANPSTATETQTDPTVARTIRWAKKWGYDTNVVCNVRAWRETNPRLVPNDNSAIGPENLDHILEQAAKAKTIVCGWGNLGGEVGRSVARELWSRGIELHALGHTKYGAPRHPLYLRSDVRPVFWM